MLPATRRAATPAARDLELVTDLVAGSVVALRHGGASLDKNGRTELLARVRAGEPLEVDFDARTFVQRDAPNRNFVRIKPSILAKLARSFVGVPFLRDHDKKSIGARGGTVVASELVEESGVAAFQMTIRAIKPWAVEGVLDGTIDRFSIGFVPTGDVLCSAHKTPIFTKCSCWPGDKIRLDDTEHLVEFIVTAAEGVETSAVNVPAVVGTGIKSVRSTLMAFAAASGGRVPPRIGPRVVPAVPAGRPASRSFDAALVAAAHETGADLGDMRALAGSREWVGQLSALDARAAGRVIARDVRTFVARNRATMRAAGLSEADIDRGLRDGSIEQTLRAWGAIR